MDSTVARPIILSNHRTLQLYRLYKCTVYYIRGAHKNVQPCECDAKPLHTELVLLYMCTVYLRTGAHITVQLCNVMPNRCTQNWIYCTFVPPYIYAHRSVHVCALPAICTQNLTSVHLYTAVEPTWWWMPHCLVKLLSPAVPATLATPSGASRQ